MGKQVINQIECTKCHKMFDVATEDIEWNSLKDAGEIEEDSSIHDFYVSQTIDCPFCGKRNKVMMHAKGKSDAELNSMKVDSLEI